MLRLYRKYPQAIPAEEWALRIVSIMDDPNLVSFYIHIHLLYPSWGRGVALSVTSLVMAMAQDHLEAFSICYQRAVHRLNKVRVAPNIPNIRTNLAQIIIDHQYSSEYVYYKVPIPWLQVKLLRLLQYYPPSGKWLLLLVNMEKRVSCR